MSRLIERLKEEDSSLTIGEFIKKIEVQEKERIVNENAEYQSVKEKYNNTYLKRIDDKSIFGRTLQVFYIIEIADKGKTTEYNNIYFIRGGKLTFNKRGINIFDMSGTSADEAFTEKQLSEMTKISEDDYMGYLNEYNSITNKLKSLIK